MEQPIYIHYGDDHYDPAKMKRAKNQPYPWNKPDGDTGLWASRVDATYGWKDWCENENFRECIDEHSFLFSLKPDANVVMVHCLKDLFEIPEADTSNYYSEREHIFDFIDDYRIDFEECLNEGIDAIELGWYGDEWADVKDDDMYMALYGWDCDCILVLNPDVIIPIEKEKTE